MITHVPGPRLDGSCRCSCSCVRLDLKQTRLPPRQASRGERKTIKKAS
jgi:hypothetical protein